MASRVELILELQKMQEEKFDLQKFTSNKRAKKRMKPRMLEIDREIKRLEYELGVARAVAKEESAPKPKEARCDTRKALLDYFKPYRLARNRENRPKESEQKPKRFELKVGDMLPRTFSKQTECPHCGSPGEVCENPFCTKGLRE